MAGLTLTTADAALKEFYLPAIREQLNNTIMMLKQIQENTIDVEGRRAVLSLHVTRNSGVGARAEGATLPTAGNQGTAEERVPLYYNYGRLQVSGPVIEAMKSNSGSFARAVDLEMKGLVNDSKRDLNRQIFGTSNGVIATLTTTTASNTVNLAVATTSVQIRQLGVGDVIDIGTVAAPTVVASARTITAITTTAGAMSVVIDGAAVTTTSSHFIFKSGSGGAIGGVGQKEVTGLQTIVAASGTLFNVNPTTYPVWVSYADTTGGTPNDQKFELALDEISILGGEDADLIVTSSGVSRAYAATLQAQKRFQNTLELKGGFKAISVTTPKGEVALTWDRDCPYASAFVLNTNHLTWHKSADWDWMDKDGAVLSRVPGVDAYEATLRVYADQTTDKRDAHGVLTGLTTI